MRILQPPNNNFQKTIKRQALRCILLLQSPNNNFPKTILFGYNMLMSEQVSQTTR
jgi:hypothetical protein